VAASDGVLWVAGPSSIQMFSQFKDSASADAIFAFPAEIQSLTGVFLVLYIGVLYIQWFHS
jgi:hypothetical protein